MSQDSNQNEITRLGLDAEGSFHSYSEEEQKGLVDHLNQALASDQSLAPGKHEHAHIPISAEGDDLFEAVRDGLVLGHFVNTLTEKPRVRFMHDKPKLSVWQCQENCMYVLKGARSLGLRLVNIGPEDIAAGEKKYLILGLVWQLVALDINRQVSKMVSELDTSCLRREGEDKEDFDKLVPEEVLMRWFNFHLENARTDRRVTNFDRDIRDSVCYLYLLNQLEPSVCSTDALNERLDHTRAERMLQEAQKIGCRKFLLPDDVVKGVARLNFAFVANLFSKYPSMPKLRPPTPPPEETPEEPEAAEPEPVQEEEEEEEIDVAILPEVEQKVEELADVDTEELSKIIHEKETKTEELRQTVRTRRYPGSDSGAAFEAYKKQNEERDLAVDARIAEKEVETAKMALAEAEKETKILSAVLKKKYAKKEEELKNQIAEEEKKAAFRERYAGWSPAELQWAIQGATKEKEHFMRQIENMRDMTAEEREQLEELQETNMELTSRIQRLNEDRKATTLRMTKKEQRMMSNVSDAQESAEKMRTKLEEINTGIQEAESDTMHLKQEKRKLDAKYEEKQDERFSAERMLEELNRRTEQNLVAADKARDIHLAVSKLIAAEEYKIAKLDAQTTQVKHEAKNMEQERMELEEHGEDLLDSINEQQTKTKVARTQVEIAQADVEDAQEELEDATVDAAHDIEMIHRQVRQEVEAKQRMFEVAKKKEQLKVMQLSDEAAAAQAAAERGRDYAHEMAQAADEAENRVRTAETDLRLVTAERETVMKRIDKTQEDLEETEARITEEQTQQRALANEEAAMRKAKERAQKQAMYAESDARKAAEEAEKTAASAELLENTAAEDERTARNMLKMKTDAEAEQREVEARLDEAEEERAEQLKAFEREKEAKQERAREEAARKTRQARDEQAKAEATRAALEASLEEATKSMERMRRSRDETAKRKQGAEAALKTHKKKAKDAAKMKESFEETLNRARALTGEKKMSVESQTEQVRALERKTKEHEQKLVQARMNRGNEDYDKQKKAALAKQIAQAQAAKEELERETKEKLKAERAAIEEDKEQLRERKTRQHEQKKAQMERQLKRDEEKALREQQSTVEASKRKLAEADRELKNAEVELKMKEMEKDRLERQG